jgi:hypothetical protein
MKKLFLLLSVIALLIVATGAVSAGKPEPQIFTITGYTVNDPYSDYETLPNGHLRLHILAQGGGEDRKDDKLCKTLYGAPCQTLCQDVKSQACGVSGYFEGKFAFEEWVDFDPLSGTATNHGVVTITPAKPHGKPDGRTDDRVVVQFNGTADSQRVLGKFKIEKANGKPEQKVEKRPDTRFSGQGDYEGDAGLVFSVMFTGKLKD